MAMPYSLVLNFLQAPKPSIVNDIYSFRGCKYNHLNSRGETISNEKPRNRNDEFQGKDRETQCHDSWASTFGRSNEDRLVCTSMKMESVTNTRVREFQTTKYTDVANETDTKVGESNLE